jgi:hypothetical protein
MLPSSIAPQQFEADCNPWKNLFLANQDAFASGTQAIF